MHEWPEFADSAKYDKERRRESCPVVAIGASAGGLAAFTQLLQSLPANTGLAFVLVQHLDPRSESILAEILAEQTAMPVNQAIESTRVEPNHVYVIPPNTSMTIRKGMLRLSPRGDSRLRHLPIDFFFSSLAEEQKNRAIGVVLSGSASDGTLGLKAIKCAGGITFAQDETAQFESMPRNAVAAGAVDFVLAPGAIAQEISQIASHAYLKASAPDALIEDGTALQEIFSLLRKAKSVDFTHYKTAMILRRLSKRVALRHSGDIDSYLVTLKQDKSEVNALFDDLLINVTEFFRDPEMFEVLSEKVFAAITKERRLNEPIRIWVPGCSTGQETYSIAICLSEYLERTKQSFPIQMFGTDISNRAVDTARSGTYTEAISSVVSPERLNRYFTTLDNGTYRIARSIRDLCVFSRHDLTTDPPLSRMDLISCRNVLIYMGPILQRRVLAALSYGLQPTGCLVLGPSEGLGTLTEYFMEIDRHHKVYIRNLRLAQPVLQIHRVLRPAPDPSSPLRRSEKDTVDLIDSEANRLISDEYGPSGLLLDTNYKVVRFRGDMRNYVALPAGAATLDVFGLVHEQLRPFVKTALDEAASKNAAVRKKHVPVRRNDRAEEINVVVRPISMVGAERHFLVLFEEGRQEDSRELREMRVIESGGERSLSDELESTREYLQALIEELGTANEESQSANEELQSTNEELQTTKEELQSSNEELTTTNEEMKSRNGELSHINSDLINLLSSMRVPVVMLNKELRIRRFTPHAEKALSLIATDIGRPITDLKPRINVPDLEELLENVICSVTALEREVQDQEGRWYSMRINPYRTLDNRVEGAVLQLHDIDQLKTSEQVAQQARNYSEAIFETVREPLVVLDSKLQVETANQSFFETFGLTSGETLGRSIFELHGRQWDSPRVHRLLDEIASSRTVHFHDLELEHHVDPNGLRTFHLNARLVRNDRGAGQILLALEDVTDWKRAAEARYRRLFETAKDGILIIDAESGDITDANTYLIDLFGSSRQELVGQQFWNAGPLSAIPEGREIFKRLRTEEMVRLPEISVQAGNGQLVDIEAIGNMYSEGEKRVIQFNIRDITERKHFETKLRESAKLESLGLLAGGVAHDFNNLLTGIMGNASLLLDSDSGLKLERDKLREIVKATQRAADLTRQMLAYSGRGRFVVEAVDLSELVRETGLLVKSSIPKSIDIDLHLSKDLPAMEADATQIRQVVMNLIINAAEAFEDKSGVVRVTTGQVHLDSIPISRDYVDQRLTPGTYVSLEVADTGIGMDEATRRKIFDPFFTTKFTGRGLGLSATLGIVKGHRGSIQVDSTPGRGTTFRLLFPVSPSTRVQTIREEAAPDLHGTGLVLIVDDEQMVLRLADTVLQHYGYEVLTAPNGEAAVRLVRERGHELALVVLDLTMPVMGGEEAFAQIKAAVPDLPVVLSSGYDQREAVHRIGEHSISGFIKKPYSAQELLRVVKATLS